MKKKIKKQSNQKNIINNKNVVTIINGTKRRKYTKKKAEQPQTQPYVGVRMPLYDRYDTTPYIDRKPDPIYQLIEDQRKNDNIFKTNLLEQQQKTLTLTQAIQQQGNNLNQLNLLAEKYTGGTKKADVQMVDEENNDITEDTIEQPISKINKNVIEKPIIEKIDVIENNFKCDKCDKSYSTLSNLNKHKRNKHLHTIFTDDDNKKKSPKEMTTRTISKLGKKINDTDMEYKKLTGININQKLEDELKLKSEPKIEDIPQNDDEKYGDDYDLNILFG